MSGDYQQKFLDIRISEKCQQIINNNNLLMALWYSFECEIKLFLCAAMCK